MNFRTSLSLFSNAVRSDSAWRDKAFQLLEAAELVLRQAGRSKAAYQRLLEGSSRELTPAEIQVIDDFRQYEVGFFLVALAVENLLKALWVARNQEKIGDITNIKVDLGSHFGHDQVRIAEAACMTISEDERSLLLEFREMAEWSGKYHVPLRHEDYRRRFQKGSLSWHLFQDATDEDPWSPKVTAFVVRLLTEIRGSKN